MRLEEVNRRWIAYKTEYGINSPVLVEAICYDAEKGTAASFDVTEMFSEHYILHFSRKICLYREEYLDYILCHEFTHLADYLSHPYSSNPIGKLYPYMNTWSEYHASRRCLGMVLEKSFSGDIDPEKAVIPQSFRDISLRTLINDTLSKTGAALEEYRHTKKDAAYRIFFRYLMYLMGYISHFSNALDILAYIMSYLKVEDEDLRNLYHALRGGEPREIIPFFDNLTLA